MIFFLINNFIWKLYLLIITMMMGYWLVVVNNNTNNHNNHDDDQKTKPSVNSQEEKNLSTSGFCHPADHRVVEKGKILYFWFDT